MKNERGVTMIALVVTVIIMVILAAVMVSIATGENGTITQAKNATTASKVADERERLEFLLTKYNTSNSEYGIIAYLETLRSNGEIKDYYGYKDPVTNRVRVVIERNGYLFYLEKEGDQYGVTYAGNIVISDNYDFLTEEDFNDIVGEDHYNGLNQSGAYIYSGGDDEEEGEMSLIVFDRLEKAFCIQVRKGKLNMYIAEDITLTNSGLERSAIDIWPGAELNITIESGKTLTVDSGKGLVGADASTYAGADQGGDGGFAGIHVPRNLIPSEFDKESYAKCAKINQMGDATLVLNGEGTLVAYGGNAGAGGYTAFSDGGSAGGGGAGAGIGGNGGRGGNSNSGGGRGNDKQSATKREMRQGGDAFDGEDCGTIYILGDIEVYAYGGGGGAGGDLREKEGGLFDEPDAGAGAGGYPGAGIGGGGRRRRWWKSPIWRWRI